jgi:hypothetical protein
MYWRIFGELKPYRWFLGYEGVVGSRLNGSGESDDERLGVWAAIRAVQLLAGRIDNL